MNRITGRVESFNRRDAVAWLRLKGTGGVARLASRIWQGIRVDQEVTVTIRPEDVLLGANHPGRISARNILPGHVRSVKLVREGAAVKLAVGFPLVALVTRRAASELGLRRGSAVYAILKATAVVPEVQVRTGVRVSVVGARGMIAPERLDFLRALDRSGSLTEGARAVGVTYRTGWLWARAANRAWGASLVSCRRGGRGGGGAVLTPAGRSLLAYAAVAERRAGACPAQQPQP